MRQNHRLRVFEKRDIPFVHLFPDQGQSHISQTEFGGFSRHHRHPSLGSVSAIHRSFVSISISGVVRTHPPLAKGWPSLTLTVAGRDKVFLQFTLRTPYPSPACSNFTRFAIGLGTRRAPPPPLWKIEKCTRSAPITAGERCKSGACFAYTK